MSNASIVPVIMSGGSGSRLWPVSRRHCPKQFLSLVNGSSMIQDTVRRLDGIEGLGPSLVVCNESQRFLVAEQLRAVDHACDGIVLEPVGRNTAPAVALAALQATANGKDPLLLVLAADHVIQDLRAFQDAVSQAAAAAAVGALVTFGIVPTRAETGYGYIRVGQGDGVRPIESFVEKPNESTAQVYFDTGDYFWNSGIFLFRASVYLEELACYQPEVLAACQQALAAEYSDLDFIRLDEEAFKASPDISIDYAVMENTNRAVMVALDAGWSDVGAWSALWDIGDKDDAGNVVRGDVILEGVKNSYLYSSERLIGVVGVDNLVVVETPDAVLVADKSRVQDVKSIVNQLRDSNRSETEDQLTIYRPWGNYRAVDAGERFQVKHIRVRPGEQLSLQKHHHRAEHWIVVSGTAKVTKGDQTFLVSENQSTYIPIGEVHRLENPGKIPLDLIEVQTGSYLGEDDIERFEDLYGR